MDRSQPAEDQTHDERAPAGGEGKWQTGNDDGEQSYQATEEDADADEDHVRHHRLVVGVAEVFGGALDVALGTEQSQQVAPFHPRFRQKRHGLAGPGQLLQKHAPGEFHRCQLGDAFPDNRFVGDYHVKELDRKIEKFLVVHLSPNLRASRHQKLRAGQDSDGIALADDCVGFRLDDLALPPDPGDEDASFSGPRLQFAHTTVDQVQAIDPVGANCQPLESGHRL